MEPAKSAASKDGPAYAAREARLIARAAISGALATFRRAKREPGHPYVSKVGVALDGQGQAIFLFSTLAAHTQDLLADGRCSLLLEAPVTTANPLQSARATLSGRARRLEADEAQAARAVYLARHPSAARYADFGDFAFWAMAVDKIHFVGGFGSARWAKGVEYGIFQGDIAAARLRLLADVNGARRAELLRVAGLSRRWRAIDVDPDGLTLGGPQGKIARLNFPTPAKDVRSWRARFAACVKRVTL
ncbi:MAG: CREG family protein [Rhodospirillales bacterium]|nr:CREG family protein [Rhodospirillales bacterium]